MALNYEDFRVDCSSSDQAVVSGVLRLPSPAAYEERLLPIREAIMKVESLYVIDVSGVMFLNSSGITGLSRLVLLARTHQKRLKIIGSKSAAWQGKTLRLIARLYDKLDIQLV